MGRFSFKMGIESTVPFLIGYNAAMIYGCNSNNRYNEIHIVYQSYRYDWSYNETFEPEIITGSIFSNEQTLLRYVID